MRNSLDGSDKQGKFWRASLFLQNNLKIQIEIRFLLNPCYKHVYIIIRFSHDSNPRMGTDFVWTTRKDTLNSSFLCSRVSEHFFISFILREFWMLIVSIKNSRLEYFLQSLSSCSISCTFFQFWGQQTLKWFFLLQFKHNYAGHFPLG